MPNPAPLPAFPEFTAGQRGSDTHTGKSETSGCGAKWGCPRTCGDTWCSPGQGGGRTEQVVPLHPWPGFPEQMITEAKRPQAVPSRGKPRMCLITRQLSCSWASPLEGFTALAPQCPLDKTLRLRPRQLTPPESHQPSVYAMCAAPEMGPCPQPHVACTHFSAVQTLRRKASAQACA